METCAIIWLRHDLRLSDNPALCAAVETGLPVVPLYILDEQEEWPLGGASKWWLHHSLKSLENSLKDLGLNLLLKRGRAEDVLTQLAERTGASYVFWNRRYAAYHQAQDKTLKQKLKESGLTVESFNSHLLYEPWTVRNKSGGAFKVFTPFWKHLQTQTPDQPLPAPKQAKGMAITGDNLADWALLPTKPNWAGGFKVWQPGEAGAQTQLDNFLAQGLNHYASGRDRPDQAHTSRLSPHLAFGEISPRQIWHAVEQAKLAEVVSHDGAQKFLSEVAWREFAYHLLYHFPTLPKENYKPAFNAFPWGDDAEDLRQWQRGKTGYPIVDAGLRELWATGWMHNRVRMITASFLIKDLLVDWRAGAAWFWDTLVDADLANNSASWQWVAGSGADASPYFRIFNPVTQGEKFDPEGAYVKRWCPELAKLPAQYIHKPWEAPQQALSAAGVVLGKTYPKPMVDHAKARKRALAALEHIKTAG